MPLTYDPEFARALATLLPILSSLPTPKVHDIQARRDRIPALFGSLVESMPDAPNISVDIFTVKSYDNAEITVHRIYTKEAPIDPTPAYVYVYGGGFIAGSADMFVKPVGLTASATGMQFFLVDYRKAPENPYPAPTEDVYAALKWMTENTAKFNIDPSRIGITGESSGGGIAASVAIMARDRNLSPPLAKQVLIYPMLDDRNLSPIAGIEELAFWSAADNITGWTALLGDGVGKRGISPYAAPARVESVDGLPPLYVEVGELDIFKSEIIDYVARFAKANISTEFHLYPGLPHGFDGIAPASSATKRAIENRMRALSNV
jgi:acetyl esterase/lipase